MVRKAKEKLSLYFFRAKTYTRTTKGRYTIGAFIVIILILLISLAQPKIINETNLNQPTPSAVTPTPTVTASPTPTLFVKPSIIPTAKPIILTATPNPSSTPAQNPTTAPTSASSMPTLTVNNGQELTFQIDYDSASGTTPPRPSYDNSYLTFLFSAVGGTYNPGDRVTETFHFQATKVGETTVSVERYQKDGGNKTTSYKVIIQ